MNQFIYWNFNPLAEFLHQITKKLINWARLKPKIEFNTLRITGKYDWSLVFFPKSYYLFPSKRHIFGQKSKHVEELPMIQKNHSKSSFKRMTQYLFTLEISKDWPLKCRKSVKILSFPEHL